MQDQHEIKNFSFFPDSVYRWIKTDNIGTDEYLNRIHNGFAEFRSGNKCNIDLLQEMMDPISTGPDKSIENKQAFDSLTAGLSVEESTAVHPEQNPGLRNEFTDVEFLPTTNTNGLVTPDQTIIGTPASKIKADTKSPVRLILDSNKSEVDMHTTLDLNILVPGTSIIHILKVSFPDNNVIEEIVDKVISEMDTDSIINELKSMVRTNLAAKYSDT